MLLYEQIRERFPSLSPRTVYKLMRACPSDFDRKSMAEVLALTDEDLFVSPGCGPKAVAEFRAVWPDPLEPTSGWVGEGVYEPPFRTAMQTWLSRGAILRNTRLVVPDAEEV